MRDPLEALPDVRDGLNRLERVILSTLHRVQAERRDHNVPTTLLYGRVVEVMDVSLAEFQDALQRLIGRRLG